MIKEKEEWDEDEPGEEEIDEAVEDGAQDGDPDTIHTTVMLIGDKGVGKSQFIATAIEEAGRSGLVDKD